MSWSKDEIIVEAFNELALQGYIFNVGASEKQTALRRLDSMMATWNGKGIRLGYPVPSNANSSNIDDDSNIPDWAWEASYLNLALRIAAGFGKQVNPATAVAAKQAYDVVMLRMAFPPEQKFPGTLPLGAGNKAWTFNTRPFFPIPTQPLLAGEDEPIEFD